MKRLLLLTLSMLMICMTVAFAETYDPKATAMNMLTEVYGYTEDEASQFIFDDQGTGTLLFYPADHPSWTYVLTYHAEKWLDCTTPFVTEYAAYPGEGAVRDTLRMAWENKWFMDWTAENRETLRAWMASDLNNIYIRTAFENLLGMDRVNIAQVINEFFACCYGEESGWPAVLTEWRNEVLSQYGVSLDVIGEPQADGMNRFSLVKGLYRQETTVCEFKGEVPDELASVFAASPNLSGWTCHCGIYTATKEKPFSNIDRLGMAAFEKDGQRILVLIDRLEDQWYLWTLGTKALYQDPTMELSITYDPAKNSQFIIRYDCADGVRLFHVSANDPTDKLRGHYGLCQIQQYQFVSNDHQEMTWIDLDWYSGIWTYTVQHGNDSQKAYGDVCYPCWLGVCDLADFPDTIEKKQTGPVQLPEGCTITAGVHFRKDHSSHSADLGTLMPGTIIRIKEWVPGDPYEWIKTTIGTINGYVSSDYTAIGTGLIHVNMEYPLPIAMCKNSIQLKSGTGWFDKTVAELPAGTKMHVIMDQGDWLYVVVPQGSIGWLMDVDGTYGYIRKSDVKVVATESYLDWE